MKLGFIGKLFPLMFNKVVYGYTAEALPELDMCVMDYPTIEYKGGKLLRTKTLGAGGDCCDFHVVKGA